MFSFRKTGGGKKGTDSNTSLHGGAAGEKGDAQPAPSEPLAAPVEPPTPSPYRHDKSLTLPLVIENSPGAPPQPIVASESSKKLDTGLVKTESTTGGGGAQAAKPVTVGKSSRAPTLRLREGSRVQVEGVKAKSLGDIGSKFFTFGAKKEPDLYVRFSMGSMFPPCRTKAAAKNKQTCDWGEEVVEFIVTEEITRLVGPDLKLTVQLFSEGQKGNDTLVGSAVVDMSDHLNQGGFTLPLMEGKKAKGELDLVLTYLLPGLLATPPLPEGEETAAAVTGGDEALPPPTVVEAVAPASADDKQLATGKKDTAASPAAASSAGKEPSSQATTPVEAPGGSPRRERVASKEAAAEVGTAKSPVGAGGGGGVAPQPVQEGPKKASSDPASVQAPVAVAEGGGRPPVDAASSGAEGTTAKPASPAPKPGATPAAKTPTKEAVGEGGGIPSPVPASPVAAAPASTTPALEAVRRLSSDKSGAGGSPRTPLQSGRSAAEAQAAVKPVTADGQATPTKLAPVEVGSKANPIGSSPRAPPTSATGAQGTKAPQPAPVQQPPAVVETAVEGLQVTQELAQHMLSRVKDEAAATLQDGGGAVRRMMDKVKEGVSKELQPADGPAAGQQQRPQQQQTGASPRRASLKLELSPAPNATAAAAPAPMVPLLSPSPFVQPQPASAAPAASQPPVKAPTQPSTPVAPGGKATTAAPIAAAGAAVAVETKAAAVVEGEDSVLLGTAGPDALGKAAGVTLSEVLQSMADDDDDDDEAFMLGLRPPRPGQQSAPRRPLEKDEAVTKLQAAWRRKSVGRQLRREQLHARRIQSLFRGHRDRQEFKGRLGQLRRLELEEAKRQERQRRLMVNQRELALLRLTPAMELGQMDQRRREFAARRIQHFVRKRLRAARGRHKGGRPHGLKSPTSAAGVGARASIPMLIDTTDEEEAVHDFVATYKRSCLSPRSYGGGPLSPRRAAQLDGAAHQQQRPPPLKRRLSALRLSDLHRKVMTSSKAKDRRDVMEKFESALSMGVRAVHAAKNPQSGAQVRYQRLLESRYEARLLLSARQDEDEERTDSTGSRRERVQRFRQLLGQLEAPPKLSDLREAFGLDEPEGGAPPDREIKAVPDVVLPWRLPRSGQALQLAEKAHRHALETMTEKPGRWWVTPLPEDLAEPPVDIRQVQAPPAFLSENLDPQDDPFLIPGLGGFDEDEASLWWYAYGRKGATGPRTAQLTPDDIGPGTGDILFQRARLGRPVLREKNSDDLRAIEAVEQGTAKDLVHMIMRERRKRLSAAAVAREAEARRAEAKQKEDAAAMKIQSVYRGSAVRKQILAPKRA